jgi:uncharacterized repeat protein (TIGR01451 family)
MSASSRKKLFFKNGLRQISLTASLLLSSVSQAVIMTPDLEILTISNVDSNFQTVNLQNTYSNAIPVCTYNLQSSASVPATVRITNITATSFDVRIQNPTNGQVTGAVTPGDVHCIIADEGSYTLSDGLKYEARTVLSDGTNGSAVGWNLALTENVTSSLTYSFSNPVVLGQVISSNDAEYSTFWSHGGNVGNPPTGTNISVGKQTGIDATARADETLGYIVIESGTGSGNINGVDYAAALGADTIAGVTSTTATYAISKTYKHGIAVISAMDGGDGGWAVLLGATPLASSAIRPGIDEDKDRSHTTEQVAYWVFDPVDVADLGVTINDGSATYTPGTSSVYSVTVINNGPNDATSVNVVNNAPAGTSISSWSCAGASCPAASGSGNINQTAVSLNVSDTLVYTVNLAIPSGQTGNLVNTVTVSNTNVDPISSNDTASDTDTLSGSADISVSNDDASATYTPGTTAQYTLTVSNNGPSDASSINVTNAAPAGTSITAWSCVGASCSIASGSGDISETLAALTAGASVTYTVDVSVPSDFTGNLVNVASASAAEADPVPTNNSSSDTDTQSSSADIAVTNSDGSAAYLPGATVLYNLTVSNNGPSDASSVLVTNAEPAGATISSWTCTGASCPNAAGAGSISENVLSLVAGDSVSYVVSVSVPFSFAGNLVNTATANAAELDPVATNNTATDIDVSSPDSDGDGVPDSIEISDGTDPNNPADFKDSDGDGVPDLIEIAEGTDPNDAASILDSDGDSLADYIERGGDKDGDGIGDEFESSITDTDGNNIKDDLDSDADGDGIPDTIEGLTDTDGDGIPDFLDIVTGGNALGGDSDGDGIVDAIECASYPWCADTDGDHIPNYADNDDDNDSILTSFELGAGGGVSPYDSDGDTVFDYLEPNNIDTDADTIFNYLDADDDGDGVATIDELDANGDLTGDALNPDDLDNEGIPDYLDASNGDGSGTDIKGSGDSDADGMSDAEECPAAPLCADSDGDGIPNYMISNADSDGDGILDAVEIGSNPSTPNDSDADGVPDYLENNTLDTDGDGKFNPQDADDDGDGIPTIEELGSGGALHPADSNADGIPDYLSITKIQTGLDGGAGAIDLLWLLSVMLIMILRLQIKEKQTAVIHV